VQVCLGVGLIIYNKVMQGLDNWIMGVNDPNAPFNQTDWVEQYDMILDKCEWITDEMLENDKTYKELEDLLDNIITDLSEYSYLPKKALYRWLCDNAERIAKIFEIKWGFTNPPTKGE